MSSEIWAATDEFFCGHLNPKDPILDNVLAENAAAGLPPIDVAPNQGKLLYLLIRIARSKRVLEIGTLGGYSTIWLARALPPDGQVVSLEIDEDCAAVARSNIASAGLAEKVEIIVGPATATLEQLYQRGTEKFDFIFIDADKPNNPTYLSWALKLAMPQAIIFGDNIGRNGAVSDAESKDDRVQGVREFIRMMGEDNRLEATAVQTVGSKGCDGLSLALFNSKQ